MNPHRFTAIPPQPAPSEVLIARQITFRNSTFTMLKDYMQSQAATTGQPMTNAQAVDTLIRRALQERS